MAALHPMGEGHPTPSKRSFADILASSSNPLPSSQFLKPREVYRGEPAVTFTIDEIQSLASPFRFALVGKFSKGRPSMEALRKEFLTIGYKGTFTLGLLDPRHVLIRFEHEEDYHRCWLRRFWSFQGFGMRVLKWTPSFSVDSEPSIVPIWIRLPNLPVHFFAKGPLFSIGRLVGEPLRLDASTAAITRPNVARLCVEIDLLKDLPNRVWIVNGSFGFWQKIEYENVPDYCRCCHKLGHTADVCKISNPAPTAASQGSDHHAQVWLPKNPETSHPDMQQPMATNEPRQKPEISLIKNPNLLGCDKMHKQRVVQNQDTTNPAPSEGTPSQVVSHGHSATREPKPPEPATQLQVVIPEANNLASRLLDDCELVTERDLIQWPTSLSDSEDQQRDSIPRAQLCESFHQFKRRMDAKVPSLGGSALPQGKNTKKKRFLSLPRTIVTRQASKAIMDFPSTH